MKLLNILVLQWFFVRLTKCQEKVIKEYKVLSYDYMPDGSISSRGHGITVKNEWYSIQYFILPLTGWWSKFIFLNKIPKFKKITEKRETSLLEV